MCESYYIYKLLSLFLQKSRLNSVCCSNDALLLQGPYQGRGRFLRQSNLGVSFASPFPLRTMELVCHIWLIRRPPAGNLLDALFLGRDTQLGPSLVVCDLILLFVFIFSDVTWPGIRYVARQSSS